MVDHHIAPFEAKTSSGMVWKKDNLSLLCLRVVLKNCLDTSKQEENGNKVTKINISKKAIQTLIYPVRNTVQDFIFLPIGSQLHSLSNGRGFQENVVV